MNAVYRAAYLTITATSATDRTGGFLNERGGRADHQLNAAWEHFNAEVYARMGWHHYVPAFLNGATGREGMFIYREHAFFTRRWCFQERILSRRIIHYTKGELIWECNEDVMCECHGIHDDQDRLEGEASSRESVDEPKETTKGRFNKLMRGLASEPRFQI